MSKEKNIRMATFTFSVLIHAALFVQFSNAAIDSQAQAPKIDTRISLNLLPAKPSPPQEIVKVVPPKPEPKPEQIKKIIKPKPVVPQVQQAVAPKVAKLVKRQQAVDPAPIKQRYLAQLLTYIEGHKYYPRKARRRGMEGSIEVTFQLLPNGDIKQLNTNGGPMLLRRAAKGAVNKALPLPPCPAEINCPMQVSYAMQFQLR